MRKLIFILLVGCYSYSFAQFSIDFNANVREGCGSIQSSFTPIIPAGVVVSSYQWDLGGAFSTSANPGRIFATPGKYKICLTVTDNQGNKVTHCKDDYIIVHQLPVADFTVHPKIGCSPLEVEFQDISKKGDGDIVQWLWDLGGTTGVDTLLSNQKIKTTYNSVGLYKPSLIITDSYGCKSVKSYSQGIIVTQPPKIDITVSNEQVCEPPLFPVFKNNNIHPDIQYTWKISNGFLFEGNVPQNVRIDEKGTYHLTVIAYNAQTGCRDSIVFPNKLIVGNKFIPFIEKLSVCQGEQVFFKDSSAFVSDSIFWEMGNGTTLKGKEVSFTFQNAGCFPITATSYSGTCVTKRVFPNCLEVKPLPKILPQLQPTYSCTFPMTVQVNASSTDTLISWKWNVVNDTNFTVIGSKTGQWTFDKYGAWEVQLTATAKNGCIFQKIMDTIKVEDIKAQLSTIRIQGCKPLTFTLADSSKSESKIVNWNWTVNGKNYNTKNPTITISDTGKYGIILVITNELGCKDTGYFPQAIWVGQPPVIDFTVQPKVACLRDSFQFTYTGSPNANSFLWLFGDSTNAMVKNPTKFYTDAKQFDVTLIAMHNGCKSSLTKPLFVETLLPVANAELLRDCGKPFDIVLNDKSVGADSLFWDLGDLTSTKDTSSLKTINYTYPDTGVYTITQVVKNYTTGCVHEKKYDIYITTPKAKIWADTLKGCMPLTVHLKSNSLFGDTVKWYSSFGKILNDSIVETALEINQPGLYTGFGLIVTDVNGCRDSLMSKDSIWVNTVQAFPIFSNKSGCAPLGVALSDSSKTLFGTIVQKEWQIDSMAIAQKDTIFSLNRVGVYPFQFTVKNNWGCLSEHYDTVFVKSPLTYFESDSIICVGQEVVFRNLSQGNNLKYTWDFGDGLTSTEVNPTHAFKAENNYKICLTATDDEGCDSTYCTTLPIVFPKADFTLNPNHSDCPPLVVEFTNTSSLASSYEWDFGDGTGYSDLKNPTHIFTSPGSFTVRLISKMNNTCSDTIVRQKIVNVEGPIGFFSFKIDSSCAPLKVTFFGESDDNYLYIWDFGQGTIDSSATLRNRDTIQFVYTNSGTVQPKLTLVRTDQCSRTLSALYDIEIHEVKLEAAVSDSTICEGESVRFYNLSTGSRAFDSLGWEFKGGNPSFSNKLEESVTYSKAGTYGLTLFGKIGYCIQTLVADSMVSVGGFPSAGFGVLPTTGCAPLSVELKDTSSIIGSMLSEWNWMVDNQFFKGKSVQVQLDSGIHFVRLQVVTEFGCKDEVTDTIRVQKPLDFVLKTTKDSFCLEEEISLEALFKSDTTGVTYSWKSTAPLSCTNCLKTKGVVQKEATFYFEVQNDIGCVKKDSVKIFIKPQSIPKLTITPDTGICVGEKVTLNATSNSPNLTYQWNGSQLGLSCYDCTSPTLQPSITTTYSVVAKTSLGCQVSDSVKVSVQKGSDFEKMQDRTICEGDSIYLDADLKFNQYNWQNNSTLSCLNCCCPLAYPSSTTLFSVQFKDGFCTLRDTVQIEVLKLNSVDAGKSVSTCTGAFIQLKGSGIGQPKWFTKDTVLGKKFELIYQTDKSRFLYLTVVKDACALTDSLYINILPNSDISGQRLTACVGDTITLQLTGKTDTLEWLPKAAFIQPLTNPPRHIVTATTALVARGSINGCPLDTATFYIEALPQPQVTLPSKIVAEKGIPVTISMPNSVFSKNWDFRWTSNLKLSCQKCLEPEITADSSGKVFLKVIDIQSKCAYKDTVLIKIVDECSEYAFYIPNAFSPNDDGHNDRFEIFTNFPDLIEKYEIFDRWGNRLFSSENIDNKWDGRVNGRLLDAGIYVYSVQYRCPLDNALHTKSGDLLLAK